VSTTLRVQWLPARPAGLSSSFEEEVFAQVCALQPVRPGPSQDELLAFEVDATGEVSLAYVFDHDFASQYDKTETWRATVRRAPVTLEGWRRG
jgi:hypothetical protein